MLIAAVTGMALFPAGSWAQDVQLQEGATAPNAVIYTTSITGVKARQGSVKGASLKDAVHVKTSGQSVLPRRLNLQQYSTEKKAWITRAHWMVPGSGTVTVTYPKKYRKKTTGWWRLQVPSVEATLTSPGAQGTVSTRIRVTTRNLKKVKLYSRSACVYNVTDKTVLYGRKMHTKRKQASTTKLMTAMILLKENSFRQKVKISRRAARQPWGKLSMRAGDRYRLKDMMHALLICSSNDAATALAEHNAGSVKRFATKMNRQARVMHLTRTHYKNPHGLDTSGHYTTAYDLAQLTGRVYQNRWAGQTVSREGRPVTIRIHGIALPECISTKEKCMLSQVLEHPAQQNVPRIKSVYFAM